MLPSPINGHQPAMAAALCLGVMTQLMLYSNALHSIDSGNHTCQVIDALGNTGTATTMITTQGELTRKVIYKNDNFRSSLICCKVWDSAILELDYLITTLS